MDWVAVRSQITAMLKKYRLVVWILLAGILLMMIPQQEEPQVQAVQAEEASTQTFQQELAQILSKIQGAGKVEVLLTEMEGAKTHYQTDTDQSSGNLRQETVILSGSDRGEAGLIRQTDPPIYLGALVVCQGGDIPTVKLAVVEAVMSVTGLSSDCITVLKMK